LRVGVADQIGYFRAYNTDGSAKTDLTSSTTGLTLSVFRVGAAAISISSLSAKAADNTAHADGAIRPVSGNLYTVDLPDAACADQVPSISVKGSYTGGVIEGPEHPLVGYNPASVAVGANTIAPATPTNVSDVQTAVLAKLPAALEGGRIAAVLDSATLQKIDSILEDTGTTLPAAIAAIDAGGSGTGARTVTITVNDGTTVLQNATVRVTEGANTFTALTNVSGVAVFNLDDATYTVGVTKSGYTYAGTTLIVNGTETATYSMTVVSTPAPTQPDGCVIQVLCLNGVTPQQGVAIQYRAASIPSGDLNRAFLGTTQTATSNSSGIATFEVAQGSGFEWKRGDVVEWSSETAAVAASMDVRSVIGAVR